MQDIHWVLQDFVLAKRSGAVGTIIQCQNHDWIGKRFIVNENGELISSQINEVVIFELKNDLLNAMKKRTPQVLEQGNTQIFLDPFFPNPHLIILGGGHIALPLVQIAHILGYEITAIDDRINFANTHRFPEADHIICKSFENALEELVLTPNCYVVIITRGHKHDKTCLASLLGKPTPAYIGMIGSKRKVKTILDELHNEGFDAQKLKSVYAPIGLDIGAQTPEEIALSIMAEITMVNYYGKSNGMKLQLEGK